MDTVYFVMTTWISTKCLEYKGVSEIISRDSAPVYIHKYTLERNDSLTSICLVTRSWLIKRYILVTLYFYELSK